MSEEFSTSQFLHKKKKTLDFIVQGFNRSKYQIQIHPCYSEPKSHFSGAPGWWKKSDLKISSSLEQRVQKKRIYSFFSKITLFEIEILNTRPRFSGIFHSSKYLGSEKTLCKNYLTNKSDFVNKSEKSCK